MHRQCLTSVHYSHDGQSCTDKSGAIDFRITFEDTRMDRRDVLQTNTVPTSGRLMWKCKQMAIFNLVDVMAEVAGGCNIHKSMMIGVFAV